MYTSKHSATKLRIHKSRYNLELSVHFSGSLSAYRGFQFTHITQYICSIRLSARLNTEITDITQYMSVISLFNLADDITELIVACVVLKLARLPDLQEIRIRSRLLSVQILWYSGVNTADRSSFAEVANSVYY